MTRMFDFNGNVRRARRELLFVPMLVLVAYVCVGAVLIHGFGMDPVLATVLVDFAVAGLCGVYVYRYEPRVKGDGNSLTGVPMKYMMWVMLVAVWLFGQVTAAYVLEKTGDANFMEYQSALSGEASVWLSVLLTLVAAPLCEEMMLRGLVQDCWSRINPWFGVLGSTVVFSMMHGTLVHLPSTFLMGLMAAVVYASTGRIWLSVVLHVGYNGAASILGKLSIPEAMFEPAVFVTVDVLLVAWMLLEYRHALKSHVGYNGAASILGKLSIPEAMFEPAVFVTVDVLLVAWMLLEYRHALKSNRKEDSHGEAEEKAGEVVGGEEADHHTGASREDAGGSQVQGDHGEEGAGHEGKGPADGTPGDEDVTHAP